MANPAPHASESTGLDSEEYILHVFPFSLYSIMARYTHALGCAYSHEKPDEFLNINLKLVNIHRNGNITEDYLLNVNPKGQVRI